ncbi:uncharacterized protein CLUP02_13853 [Colletotrichum lupini]|uniref:Heterokaryon incompatibility domain-containing protein n=1 Tax=Colletotrichum lupini TaxID=145971 RepID=A0A9Q8T3W1_9PEZI|nr:uncharacterized protein CLUP02_13853 [Colletotrichum lupini]UQC88330.1 hypothetical protein CLUP02_13853 [Colletotrichum lupini]
MAKKSCFFSLRGAMRAFRQQKDAVLVWVNVLSIDQQNSVEKIQRIQLTTRIYSSAKSVAIWLGPEADESGTATRNLHLPRSRSLNLSQLI